MNWNDYVRDFEETLECDKDEIMGSSYPEDTIREYVDGHIPIYNSDRALLLADNTNLGFPSENIGGDVFDQIAWAIQEELLVIACEKLGEWQLEESEEEEDEEPEGDRCYICLNYLDFCECEDEEEDKEP